MVEQAEIDIIIKKWADFFDIYDYESDINRLRERYPDERSLYISYKDLSSFDIDFADNIRKDPVTYLSAGETYLKSYIGKTREKINRLNIRLKDIPERNFKYDIRNVRSTNVDTFISVTGIIRKNTEVLPRLDVAAFRCPNCGAINAETEYYRKMNEPTNCHSCNYHGKFILEIDQSTFIDTQKLEIQENPDTLDGTSQPQRMTVIMEDDITGKIFPGDRVTIYGILKADQKFIGSIKLTEFNIFLYANNFKKETKDFEDIRITDDDEEKIKKLASYPDIIDKLAMSIAPSIYGLDVIKKALVLQLFGGVRKVLKDGTTIRGDIHILMVGDPGTAKSQLLRYMTSLAPRSVFAFGKGSSAAGLTAAAVRDDFGEGRWTLEAGALVLADNGFAAIDELDKMDQRDTASMHEAMEQQSVTISKAGIMATLKSRCSILAAANPKFGRYDVTRTIAEQIDFPPPLLSRFDIIFKLVDTPNRENDSRLAEHILMTHRIGEIYRSIENTNINIEIPDEEKYIPEIDKDLIRKYISYAKNRIFPRLSEEAIKILREEYVNTRSSGVDSIPITARQLESTIRLAEAAARARLSSIVTESDALLAKSIVDYYLKDVSAINGKVDIDILNTGMSSRQRNEAELIMDVIKELKNENKRPPEIETVIDTLASRGMSRKDAENSIQKLKIGGFLYEPSNNRIDVIK